MLQLWISQPKVSPSPHVPAKPSSSSSCLSVSKFGDVSVERWHFTAIPLVSGWGVSLAQGLWKPLAAEQTLPLGRPLTSLTPCLSQSQLTLPSPC